MRKKKQRFSLSDLFGPAKPVIKKRTPKNIQLKILFYGKTDGKTDPRQPLLGEHSS